VAKQEKYSVYIYNDQNTFQHVTMCLEMLLGFNTFQAEQVAIIVHNNGKYPIFTSKDFEEVETVYEALVKQGITARINTVN